MVVTGRVYVGGYDAHPCENGPVPQWSTSTSSAEVLRSLRQRGSAFLGWLTVVLFVGMAVLTLMAGELSLIFLGSMLLAAAAGWVLLARPRVAITLDGVDLDNPFRRTHLPWARIDDVSARWNLEIWSGDKVYKAWAIASHIDRPKRQGGGMLGYGSASELADQAEVAAPRPTEKTTVVGVSSMIETALEEWREMVSTDHPNARLGGEVRQRWDWADFAAVGFPILLIVVGLLV